MEILNKVWYNKHKIIYKTKKERGIIMEEFIGKVKEQASWAKDEAIKLGKRMYEKTNTTISIGKLSFAISETEGKIKDEYEKIGKTVYEKYLNDGSICDCLKENCETIDSLFAEKMALKEKKAELKESVACEQCGEYNKKGAAYCSKCGARLAQEDEYSYEADTEEAQDESNEDYTTYVKTSQDGMDFKEKVSDTAEKVKDAVVDAIPDKVKETMEDVKDKASETKEKVIDTAERIYDVVKDKVEDEAPEIKEKVRKVIKIKAKKPEED